MVTLAWYTIAAPIVGAFVFGYLEGKRIGYHKAWTDIGKEARAGQRANDTGLPPQSVPWPDDDEAKE